MKFYKNDLEKQCRYWAYNETKKRWYPLSTTNTPYRENAVGRIRFWHVADRRRFYRF